MNSNPPTSFAGSPPQRAIESAQSARKTVAIIELNHHAEVLRGICPLLQQRFDLVLFTTEKIWRKAGLPESVFLKVCVKPRKQSVKAFFKDYAPWLARAQVVYFNTLERYYPYFVKHPLPAPAIVRIHNVNANFLPWQSIDWGAFSLIHILWHVFSKAVVERTWSSRKAFYRQMACIVSPNAAAREYVLANNLYEEPEKLTDFSFPFCYLAHPAPAYEPDMEAVHVAITGTVDPKRKNFSELKSALLKALEQLGRPMHLHFLGGPKGNAGRAVITEFEAIKHPGFALHASEGYVPADVVSQTMRKVDFLIAPINLVTHHKIHREVYGTTKISGIESDIVTFRKPALINAGYKLGSSMAEVCETYESEQELAQKIVQWVNHKTYLKKYDAFDRLEVYEPEVILDSFEHLCEVLVDAEHA